MDGSSSEPSGRSALPWVCERYTRRCLRFWSRACRHRGGATHRQTGRTAPQPPRSGDLARTVLASPLREISIVRLGSDLEVVERTRAVSHSWLKLWAAVDSCTPQRPPSPQVPPPIARVSGSSGPTIALDRAARLPRFEESGGRRAQRRPVGRYLNGRRHLRSLVNIVREPGS